MLYALHGWLAQNSMATAFQLSELCRQFQIDYFVHDGTVKFSGGLGPVADEISGKTLVLGSWEEVYDGEIFENEPSQEVDDWFNDTPNEQDEYSPDGPDGLIEQANELRDMEDLNELH